MRRVTVFTCAVLWLVPVAQAEMLVAPSLEWLADHCIESGVYVVSGIDEKVGDNGVELSLTLTDKLRGEPIAQFRQGYYSIRPSDPARAFVAKGDEFLVCFQHYDSGEKRAVQTINLNNPQLAGYSLIAASCDLKLLKTKAEILKVFRGRLKAHADADPVEISDFSKDNRFELSCSSELFPAVYGGSACYLRVPTDLVESVRAVSHRQEQEIVGRRGESNTNP